MLVNDTRSTQRCGAVRTRPNLVLIMTDQQRSDYADDNGLMRKGVELPECLARIPLLGVDIPYGVQGRRLCPVIGVSTRLGGTSGRSRLATPQVCPAGAHRSEAPRRWARDG